NGGTMNELMEANQSLAERVNRPAQEILDEAVEKARLLKKIVQETHTFKMIGEKEHLQIEAWMTIGSFYGCTARSEVQPIEINGVHGFKAHGKVTVDRTGAVVSEADAYCMEDEENWESKDTFQQASMAQTRSMSKALANKFRWVVVLAGYATTPVEEMQGITPRDPSVLGFGKHKGKALSDVPVDYLEWLLTDLAEKKNKPELQAAICAEFERRNAAKDTKGDVNLYEWVLVQL